MSKKLKFLWIDDDPKRKAESKNIEERLSVDVTFIDVKGKDLTGELNKILTEEPPDLILMDHKLKDVEREGYTTGSTAAEVIREQWPECPIVCVTAVPLNDIDRHKKSIYEEVFPIENISNHDSAFISIAGSFQRLREKRPQGIDDLIELLGVPESDVDQLKLILPNDLKGDDSYGDESLLITISRWVRHTLIERPGFLYDRLWAATLLGLKEESFKEVEEIFLKAKYDGIFSDPGKERWWQGRLREILYSRLPQEDSIYPWDLGRKLPGINEADFSVCHVSGKTSPAPETVAFTDEAAQKRAPVRLRYTVSHPHFKESLFFEEILMMAPQDED